MKLGCRQQKNFKTSPHHTLLSMKFIASIETDLTGIIIITKVRIQHKTSTKKNEILSYYLHMSTKNKVFGLQVMSLLLLL